MPLPPLHLSISSGIDNVLVSNGHPSEVNNGRLAIALSALLRFTASDYPFGILDLRLLIALLQWAPFKSESWLFFFFDLQPLIVFFPLLSVGYCIVCPS